MSAKRLGLFGFHGDFAVFWGNLIVLFGTFWDFLCQLAWNHWDFRGSIIIRIKVIMSFEQC